LSSAFRHEVPRWCRRWCVRATSLFGRPKLRQCVVVLWAAPLAWTLLQVRH
jgi:hypothetical protein